MLEKGVTDLPICASVLLEFTEHSLSPSQFCQALKKDPILYLKTLGFVTPATGLTADALGQLVNQSNRLRSPVSRLVNNEIIQCYFNEERKQQNQLLDRYWTEARFCALSCQGLAEAINYPYPEEAYLAGLLHNLGQIIRLIRHPDDYTDIYQGSSSAVELELFEKEWFGSTSAEISALLTRQLITQSYLSDAILFQLENASTLQSAPALVKILNLASRWTQPQCDRNALYTDIVSLLPITLSQCEQIESSVKQQLTIDHKGLDLVRDQQQDNWAPIQEKVAKHIAHLAEMQSLEPDAEASESVLWQSLIENFEILYGPNPLVVFKQHENRLTAQATSQSASSKLLSLDFKLADLHDSALQNSLNGGQPQFSQKHSPIHFVDLQLANYLDARQLLYIPISSQQQPLGLIVVGIQHNDSEQWHSQCSDFTTYIQMAVKTLRFIQQTESVSRQRYEGYKEYQSEALRKLIHESANPLGVINNYVEVIKQSLSADSKTASQLDTIRKEINRVSRLLQKMRHLETPEAPEFRPLNLNRIIRAQVELFEESYFRPHNVRCDLKLESGLPELTLSAESIKQILINLFKNAVEALTESGRILVSTRSRVNFNGKLFIEMTVADNGPGIDAKVIEAAFSPIKTQKDQSHSGLGLTIVCQLVEEMGGYISCQNQTDGGAEFRVLLPYQR